MIYAVRAGDGAVLHIAADGAVTPLLSGLNRPTDVLCANGELHVAENGAGRVIRIRDGAATTLIGGLRDPRGLACLDGWLHVLDRGQRALHKVSLGDPGATSVVAENLPVGAICPLDFAGGLCVDQRRGLLIAADGEGSILRLTPN